MKASININLNVQRGSLRKVECVKSLKYFIRNTHDNPKWFLILKHF